MFIVRDECESAGQNEAAVGDKIRPVADVEVLVVTGTLF